MFNFDLASSLQTLAVAFVPVLLGIVLHEVAHGWVASLRGDLTARMLGRLTLNPVPHIDPAGLAVFALTAMASPVVFGWAKPVPVNPRNMRNPRRDMVLVSAAGPLANFCLALVFALLLRLILTVLDSVNTAGLNSALMVFLIRMCAVGVMANLALGWINLLPIPPLDGGNIMEGILPRDMARAYSRLERYGFIILILLLATGIVAQVLSPLIMISLEVIGWIAGLPAGLFFL